MSNDTLSSMSQRGYQLAESPSEGWSGRNKPALGIAAASPKALSEAVLPPVLGPVKVTTLTPAGTQKSTGCGGLALAYIKA